MDAKFEILKLEVQKDLVKAEAICLTTDLWKEVKNSRGFLGVTAHLIRRNELVSVVLATKHVVDRHTGINIAEQLTEVQTAWGITLLQIIAIVTDGAANIVCGSKIFIQKEYKHIWCCAHLINLIAEEVLECDAELITALRKIEAVIEFFRRSQVAADDLNESQESVLKLIKYCETRWNSKFLMIQRHLKLNNTVTTVSLRHISCSPMLTAAEIKILQEAILVLSPLEEATRHLSGEKYVSGSFVIPLINCLKTDILALRPETNTGKNMKSAMLDAMDRPDRFGNLESNKILMIAMILDPRFKQIHAKHPVSVTNAFQEIEKLLRIEDVLARNKEKEKRTDQPKETETLGLWRHHDKLVQAGSQRGGAIVGSMQPELRNYLSDPVLADRKVNPIQFWNENKARYPSLSKIALRYAVITATSVPSERYFSKAGNIMTDDRNRLDPYRLPKLLFLNSMSLQQWLH